MKQRSCLKISTCLLVATKCRLLAGSRIQVRIIRFCCLLVKLTVRLCSRCECIYEKEEFYRLLAARVVLHCARARLCAAKSEKRNCVGRGLSKSCQIGAGHHRERVERSGELHQFFFDFSVMLKQFHSNKTRRCRALLPLVIV